MTLAQMISLFRERQLLFGNNAVFRDGHSTDPSNSDSPVASVSITSFINSACRIINSRYGLNVQTTKVAGSVVNLINGVLSIDPSWVDVLYIEKGGDIDASGATWQNSPYMVLSRASVSSISGNGWNSPRMRIGNHNNLNECTGYILIGNTKIRFIPAWTPLDASMYLYITHVAAITPLADVADTPSWIPSDFHEGIVFEAVRQSCIADASNPNSSIRAESAMASYKEVMAPLEETMRERMSTGTHLSRNGAPDA